MALDATTETIAHFAGHFDIVLDVGRLRPELTPFEHAIAEDALEARTPEEPRPPEPDYALREYRGDVAYEPPPTPVLDAAGAGAEVRPPAPPPGAQPTSSAPPEAAGEVSTSIGAGGGASTWFVVVPPPASLATLTIQGNRLVDNDLVTLENGVGFASLAPFAADLAAATRLAGALESVVLGPVLDDAAPTKEFALAVLDRVQAAAAPSIEPVDGFLARGDGAGGRHVDGEVVDALPAWSDLLPAALRADVEGDEAGDDTAVGDGAEADSTVREGRAEPGTAAAAEGVSPAVGDASGDDVETEDDEPTPPDPSPDPFARTPAAATESPPSTDDNGLAHEVVTGANRLVNEVAIASNWLDGKVVVVGGDVVDLDVIVQHAILTSRDSGAPTATGTARASGEPAGEAPDAGPPPADVAAASHVAPTAGALADADGTTGPAASRAINAAQVTATPAATAAPGGDGTPTTVSLTRLDGGVTLFNRVEQSNFVTDMDRVAVESSAYKSFLGTGENLALNQALLSEIGYEFDAIFVGGDFVDLDIIQQTNVLLDDDGHDVGGAAVAGDGGAANVALNKAVLESKAIDTYAEMADTYAQAMADLESGMDVVADAVRQDPLFQGQELLRALHIEGDLTLMNVVEQRNVLGDQDQIQLATPARADAGGDASGVTTGSNALLNAATLTEYGVDSTIMAAGRVYDDALLYQAGLVDTDAQPTGVQLPALANEAVAFLADDFLAPKADEEVDAASNSAEWASPVDLLQTMLA